eukprot:TRINITY_DN27220_c0_g1_i1.p1 TRINITY_DN27220_c0_g1~~TRINITY_DN27220_c0_g1_i1.p1  ORF type:complete len:414 (+),score=60.29 TRINITY_DN27220_c0_g1_i1:39-1280(+)
MTEIIADTSRSCPECKDPSKIRLDHSLGTLVCTGCGLVLEDHCLDEGREWRNFASDGTSGGNTGRERGDVMGAADEFTGELAGTLIMGADDRARKLQKIHSMAQKNDEMSSAGLAEAIDAVKRAVSDTDHPEWKTSLVAALQKPSQSVPVREVLESFGWSRRHFDRSPDRSKLLKKLELRKAEQDQKRSLQISDKRISDYASKARTITHRLNLGENVVNRCVGFMQELVQKGELKSRCQNAWFCALVHLATREERVTRTVKEIASCNHVADEKTQEAFERQIQKNVQRLAADLNLVAETSSRDHTELMQRYVARMGLSHQVCEPASYIAKQAYRYGIGGKLPQSAIVASCIFIVAWLLDVSQKPRFQDVGVIAGTTEGKVQAAYAALLPCLRNCLPENFHPVLKNGLKGLPSV